MFSWVCLVYLFNIVYSLQCAHNCSMISSMTERFLLPHNCSSISNHRCSVKILFWYQRNKYVVTFPGDEINDIIIGDQRDFMMIEIAKKKFFSYEINHICKDRDDCARIYAEKRILEMTQRILNLENIYMDLARILRRQSTAIEDLACFDTNDGVCQCAIPGSIGSCQIIDSLTKHKLHRRSCQRTSQESVSVNIYDSGSFAMMTVKCNRMLCNGPLTIEAVKNVLKYYNITDINGRLLGNTSRMSSMYYLFILALFFTFELK